jgi:hypothetical protein
MKKKTESANTLKNYCSLRDEKIKGKFFQMIRRGVKIGKYPLRDLKVNREKITEIYQQNGGGESGMPGAGSLADP